MILCVKNVGQGQVVSKDGSLLTCQMPGYSLAILSPHVLSSSRVSLCGVTFFPYTMVVSGWYISYAMVCFQYECFKRQKSIS